VKILDDDDTCAILELYPIVNTIKLYVKNDFVGHQLREGHRELSHMLDLDNESKGSCHWYSTFHA